MTALPSCSFHKEAPFQPLRRHSAGVVCPRLMLGLGRRRTQPPAPKRFQGRAVDLVQSPEVHLRAGSRAGLFLARSSMSAVPSHNPTRPPIIFATRRFGRCVVPRLFTALELPP